MNKKITILLMLASINATFSQNLNFINKADKPISRAGSASSIDQANDNIYIVNGFSSTQQTTSEIEKYNLYENTWSLFPTSPSTISKKYGNMEIITNTMYLFNGLTSTGINDKLELVNLDNGTLTVNSTLNPNPVYSGGSSVWGDFLVTFGGCSNQFNAIYSKKLYKIAPWGEWTALADMPVGLETKGEVISGTGSNSKLYVFGGYNETNSTNENFQNITSGTDLAITDWVNVAETGTKLYKGLNFGTNKYAQFSAFESVVANQQASNISWLITNPMTALSTDQVFLNFETKDGYNNGATLQAYLITNWTGNITTSTKTLINANIANGTTTGYAVDFTASGNIQLTGNLSNFRIGFKYVGGYSPSPATTTYQVDNVRVYKTHVSNNIYIYDFASNTWSTSNTVLPQSLSAYAVAKGDATDTKLYITGDYSNQTFTGFYDTASNQFTSLTQTNMIGRRHHTSEVWNNNLFIFGGNTSPSISSCLSSAQSAAIPTLTSDVFVLNDDLKIYPNPVTDILYFDSNLKSISIYALDGKKIAVEPINNTLDVSNLTNGFYVVVTEDQNGKINNSKLIKK